VRPPVNLAVLERAWEGLLDHHDALRLRYRKGEGGWQAIPAETDGALALTRIDLTGLPEAERRPALEGAAANLQASLRLSEGPLVRAVYFDLGPDAPGRLFLTIHHLLVDAVSWRILVEDLQAACEQLGRGQRLALPSPTTSFGQWAREQERYAKADALEREAGYWLSLPWNRVSPLPVDKPGGVNSFGSARQVSVSLDVEETRSLLQVVPQRYKTQINDVLLTALARAFQSWSGRSLLLVDLEGHGREAIADAMDLSRTVGWFTTMFPVLLDLEGAEEPLAGLRAVKEHLRAVPGRGIGYGQLRYLGGVAETRTKLSRVPQAEVNFLYLGRFDTPASGSGLFRMAEESSGPVRSPRDRRRHLLEVNGQVSEGQLLVSWTYSENLHHRSTIEGLAESFRENLRGLIARAQTVGSEAHTTSDFPAARLEQTELEKVLSSVKRAGSAVLR
jgi:non-ribosomal peptide synthase protein (TIGR01720 family)